MNYDLPRLARASGEATWFMVAIRRGLSVLMWLWLLRVDLREGRWSGAANSMS
jgi:hypothetical protein